LPIRGGVDVEDELAAFFGEVDCDGGEYLLRKRLDTPVGTDRSGQESSHGVVGDHSGNTMYQLIDTWL
jgi:hypothetical protein